MCGDCFREYIFGKVRLSVEIFRRQQFLFLSKTVKFFITAERPEFGLSLVASDKTCLKYIPPPPPHPNRTYNECLQRQI